MRAAIALWSGLMGGAETFAADLARFLRQRGHHTEILFLTFGGPLEERLRDAGTPSFRLGIPRGRRSIFSTRALGRILREHRVDTLVLPTVGHLAAVCRLAGFRGRMVGIDHGGMLQFRRLPLHQRLAGELDRVLGVPFLDAQVCVSDCVLAAAARRPHARSLTRIHNGVDTTRFAPAPPPEADNPDDGLRIGFAGRLVPGKGLDTLLASAAMLPGGVSWRLTVAGEGPLLEPARRIASRLPAHVVTNFLGRQENMPAFYAACDVVVVSSDLLVESFCLVAAEAMACGRPVIGSRLGGIPEVVADNETGILVSPGSAGEIAAALSRYAADPQLRQLHGASSRQRAVRMFTFETCASSYETLLSSCGSARGRRRPRSMMAP